MTASCDGPRAVADRVLRLDGEQQGGGEVVDAVDAGGPRVIVHVIDVAMTPADDVPATTPAIGGLPTTQGACLHAGCVMVMCSRTLRVSLAPTFGVTKVENWQF